MRKDEYVRILDYLPNGKSDVPPHRRKPIAQAVGEKYFSLLELVPREGMAFEMGERIYIGESVRDRVDHIERRIKYEWLTPIAKSELPFVLEKAIKDDETNFIEFYNTAGTISTRQHKLEVMPRIGKRHRDDILKEREAAPFKDFADMQARLKSVPDPVRIIADKIVEELQGASKYYLFVPLIRDRDLQERY